jgi:anti-sigma-K factor RskA
MGHIKTAAACEHGFSVDECVDGMCELQAEDATLRAHVARLKEALKEISTLYWVDAPAPEEMRRIARRALEEK